MKRTVCEYERECSITSNEFCTTDDRFSCVVYRDVEEKQLRIEDDL